MSVVGDIRHAFRILRRTPAVTSIALASIALTVGATAVVFAAVKSVLLDPLPYADPGALYEFRMEYSMGAHPRGDWVTWPDIQDVVRSNRSFESIATYNYALFNFTGDGNSPPEAHYGLYASANLFPVLGVKPMLGRNILPEEQQPGRDHEMILSYGLWTSRFHADPNIVGRSVEVNGHPCLIIGVMPQGFDFPLRLATTVRTPSGHMDFWAPQAINPAQLSRIGPAMSAVGRLRKDVSGSQAEQEALAISAVMARQFPLSNGGRLLHLVSLEDRTFGFARTGLLLLLAGATMFLLIGCSNVANLLLARLLARHSEMAVRVALGAGRGRLLGQLVVESCVLGVAGGLAGFALAALAWKLLPAVAPVTIPRLAAARADWTVLLFTVAISILSGFIFGIAPALAASRRDPAEALRQTGTRGAIGRASNRLRSSLVVSEVAIAVMLVVVGGLLAGAFIRLIRTDPGFDAEHVVASIIIASGDQYRTPEAREPLFRRIVDAVRAIPGVESAGTVDALPFSGENNGGLIGADESVSQARDRGFPTEVDRVSAGYLSTMGVRLLEGRWFRDDDMAASRDTAIISSTAAGLLWPGQSAVGRKVCMNGGDGKAHCRQVIGVVSPLLHSGLQDQFTSQIYSASGALGHAQFLVVRTSRSTAEIARAIPRAVASADPKQPVFLSATMSTLIGDSIADRRFIMTLLAITGCLALFLAAAGVYGVISYATSLRTQEIGVRMALGATPANVRGLIFRQGMLLAGMGIAVGLAAALVIARILRSRQAELAAIDPALVGMAVALVIAVAALACWIPARRATRIDPVVALREP